LVKASGYAKLTMITLCCSEGFTSAITPNSKKAAIFQDDDLYVYRAALWFHFYSGIPGAGFSGISGIPCGGTSGLTSGLISGITSGLISGVGTGLTSGTGSGFTSGGCFGGISGVGLGFFSGSVILNTSYFSY
jgi:hypothetical protein